MTEPALDLSEIVDLYKEDARRMIEKMHSALDQWQEVQEGGPARKELRKLSHQLRGSGRTYGFRQVTRYGKAIESIIDKFDKNKLPTDERSRDVIRKTVERLAAAFRA